MDAFTKAFSLLILLVYSFSTVFALDKSTLKFVQVLFRHGDRNPNNYMFLPTDPPELRIPWQPDGKSELTKLGVKQLYGVGQHLRKRYGYLVDYKYRPSELYVHSGEDNRTSQSAMALVAGFFPPTEDQSWNPNLAWIPIPIHTENVIDDNTFAIFENCPKLLDIILNDPAYIQKMDEWKDLMEYISEKSGVKVDTLRKMDKLVDNLLIREIHNDTHPLPGWANKISEKMSFNVIKGTISDLVYGMHGVNRATGGWMISEVVSQMNYYIDNLNKHKIFFYSGHDSNLGAVANVLELGNVQKNDLPFFGSYFSFELHEENGKYYVQIFVREKLEGEPLFAPIKSCPDPCPIEKFAKITPLISSDQWYVECGNMEDKTASYRLATIILAVICAIFIILLIGACSCYCSTKSKLANWTDPEKRRLMEHPNESMYIRNE